MKIKIYNNLNMLQIYSIISIFAPPQLSVYESTSEDDHDTGYGMTGEDLRDSDRIADAINKAEKHRCYISK